MSLFDSLKFVDDTYQFSAGDIAAIHVSMKCNVIGIPGFAGQITPLLAQQSSIQGVADITEDTGDLLNIFSTTWGSTIQVIPGEGRTAGEIRNAVNTAMSAWNIARMIPCNGFTVDAVGIAVPFTLNPFASNPAGATISAVSLVAIAVIAVVLFVELRRV